MAQTFKTNMKRFNGVDWDTIIPNLKPNYVFLGSTSSMGSQTINNASKYKMFFIQFTVLAQNLNNLEFVKGFHAGQDRRVGVNFFDHYNVANVFLNASISGSMIYVDDFGEMPFNMITGSKGFSISVYGVEWI